MNPRQDVSQTLSDPRARATDTTAPVLPEPYQFIRHLGSGGMGDVWECRIGDDPTARVAVKTIRRTLLRDDTIRRRFARECSVLSELSHTSIAKVHRVEPSADPPFLVLELLEGETLADAMIERRDLTLDAILDIGIAIAEALAHAHARGVVHRDIKPSNIFLSARGPVLTDFGLAILRDADDRLTDSGYIAGTIAYAAPELLLSRSVTPEVDVYSLGVVLFECAAGRLPFEGNSPVAQAVARLTASPFRLRDVRPNGPPELEDLLARCLAREPEERPDAAAVAEALITLRAAGEAPQGRRRVGRAVPWAAALVTLLLVGAFVVTPHLLSNAGPAAPNTAMDGVVASPRRSDVIAAGSPAALKQESVTIESPAARGVIVTLTIVRTRRQTRGLTPIEPSPAPNAAAGSFLETGDEVSMLVTIGREGWAEVYLEPTGSRDVVRIFPDEDAPRFVQGGTALDLGVFRIEPPAGTDKLFVVFSEREAGLVAARERMRKSPATAIVGVSEPASRGAIRMTAMSKTGATDVLTTFTIHHR